MRSKVEAEIIGRYALALALVPDLDAAGDLFMDTRDETDLRSAANRWRSRNGLPPAPELVTPMLLVEDQVAFALHLAQRARIRGRLRLLGACMGTLLCLAVAGLLLNRLLPVRSPAREVAQGAPIPLDHTIDLDGFELLLTEAVIRPTGMTITYSYSAEAAERIHLHHVRARAVGAGSLPLSIQTVHQADTGRTVTFAPLPAGSQGVELWFGRAKLTGLSTARPDELLRNVQSENWLTTLGHLEVDSPWLLAGGLQPAGDWMLEGGHWTDTEGHQLPYTATYQGLDGNRRFGMWQLVTELPPGVKLDELQLWLPRYEWFEAEPVIIKLNR